MERGRCKTCRREIVWVRFSSGKAMPLDPDPSADGNVYQGSDGRWRAAGKADADAIRRALTPLYLAHFVTCPQAAQHRRHAAKAAPLIKTVEVIAIADGSSRQLALGMRANAAPARRRR
jgi:hypothetical protein